MAETDFVAFLNDRDSRRLVQNVRLRCQGQQWQCAACRLGVSQQALAGCAAGGHGRRTEPHCLHTGAAASVQAGKHRHCHRLREQRCARQRAVPQRRIPVSAEAVGRYELAGRDARGRGRQRRGGAAGNPNQPAAARARQGHGLQHDHRLAGACCGGSRPLRELLGSRSQLRFARFCTRYRTAARAWRKRCRPARAMAARCSIACRRK